MSGRLRRWGFLKWIGLAALLLLLWFGADLAYVTIGAETDHAAPADVIVVLGCNPYSDSGPSPCMKARGGHAAELYKQGLADAVLATGNPVESSVLQQVLESEGVPAEAITRESNSYNTIQNIVNSRVLMQANGWRTALLVTEPFHINRSSLIARDIWGSEIVVYPSPAIESQNWESLSAKAYHLSRDAVSLMLYQVKALAGIRE